MPINFAVKLAVTVAAEALQVGLQASKRTTGPRLDELTVTVADYGTPLPRFLGERRFACPVFHAEDLHEVEKSSKVKGGGKQTTYHYNATFACAIADNAIDKVLKIFFDDKLVYDATGTGPISYAASLGIDLNSVMRIYYGTETQTPDPRYASWCEDRYGANSAPAYRGLSYLFFEELPVDNFGNRIPQISVIAVSAADDAFPFESLAGGQSLQTAAFSPDFTKLIVAPGSTIQVWDVPTRTLISSVTPAHPINGLTAPNNDGSFYCGGTGSGSTGVSLVGEGGDITELSTTSMSGAWNITAGLFGTTATVLNSIKELSGTTVVSTTVSFHPTWYFTDLDGKSLALGGKASAGSYTAGFGFYDIVGAAEHLVVASTSGETYGFDNGAGQYFVWQADKVYLVDKSTFAITAGPISTATIAGDNRCAFIGVAQGSTTIWLGFSQYSTADLSLVKTHVIADWASGTTAEDPIYDPINDAIWTRGTLESAITVRYLNRASNAGTTLGAIVSKMCDAAGLTDRDTSALTQTVQGYSWTRGDVKSQMEPALDIHDVDARPHDWEIEFLPRGTSPSGTILTQDFAKNSDGPRYTVTIQQDTDLPKILRVNFADTEFDQQVNNVLSPLPVGAVDSQRDDAIDLTTYADTPAGAQQKADRYMRREWNSRESIENALTAQSLALEPGDTTTLSLDGITQSVRLTKQTLAGGRMDCTFIRDDSGVAAVNSSTAGPSMGGRDPEVISIPAPVTGFVIDAPYRYDSDADVRPLLYSGAGSYASLPFPGAAIYEASPDGVYDTLFDAVSTGATWGACSSALGSVSSPWMWDRGNTLSVTLHSGSLTSVSEADIDADPTLNLILVGSTAGWEYVNFATATLQGDGSYNLTDLKRGRRGTEWMCNAHVTGEKFILASSLDVDEMGTGDVGGDFSFKAQAIGRAIDSATAINVTYAGDTLKPYAPASISWAYNGTDITGTITRRTRIGGAWLGGSTIPLSENSEAYEVDVYNGVTFKRTITLSGTNVFTYTAAMAAADGITLPTHPTVNIYQMSDAVGRGFALAA